MTLPGYLTITKGQRFAEVLLLQHPRIAAFVHDNSQHFKYNWIADEAVYSGPDAVIPDKPKRRERI